MRADAPPPGRERGRATVGPAPLSARPAATRGRPPAARASVFPPRKWVGGPARGFLALAGALQVRVALLPGSPALAQRSRSGTRPGSEVPLEKD